MPTQSYEITNDTATALEAALKARISGEVRFDAGSRALYATDASNYRQVPIGVVIPRTIDDVVETVALCRQYNAPIFGRGAGTSLAGQCCNVAICIDFSKYLNKVVEIDQARSVGRVQPGTILDDLRDAAEKHKLTFGPDPATHDRCTLGGMLGNNSCGIHSVMAGRTVDNVESLEILTYDGTRMRVGRTTEEELEKIISEGGRRGEIYAGLKNLRDRYADLIRQRFPVLPRRVSGFNLEELLPENGFNVARALVGTEGTCVTILEATLNLVYSPPVRSLLVLGYPDVFHAADHVPEILTHKPVGLEGMDDYLLDFLKKKHAQRTAESHARPTVKSDESAPGAETTTQLKPRGKDASDVLPPGHGWLLVEFGGETREEANEKCRDLMRALSDRPSAPTMKLMEDPREEAMVWEVRKSGLGATAFLPNGKNTWPGWEDAAVPPDRLAEYLRDFKVMRDKFGYESAMYGHFGDGCVHMRIDFDMTTQEGIDKFVAFLDEAADLVVKYGGALSGEHGDGQARAHLLPKMFGPELVEAFREFKTIWDPQNQMNPGKVVDPFGPDENLRLGAGYQSPAPHTHFHWTDSDGKFGRALLRCVGVGRCRRLDTGTMCPSFMVTREEKHSTRGRARLLSEMLRGEVVKGGWQSEEVKEALDLCLACKGCKSDCPVNVDMASYKAEFLSHYYEKNSRPVQAYAMGLITWWARLASVAPWLVNFVTHAPLLGSLMKTMGGIAPQRRMPRFASRTFKQLFRKRVMRNTGGQRVILWPDTFNNHFTPEISMAGADVLEAAGFHVIVPMQNLCCGRPLYDHGMLDLAKKLLKAVLHELRDEIEAGTPLVGLEPSCAAVFRDELVNLFPDDPLAQKLSRQTFVLSEFLELYAPDWEMPQLPKQAVLHGHCHQKAIMGLRNDEAVLKRMGVQFKIPDSGCCGMAGSFGFSRKHYDISIAVGERVLLPAVRDAHAETLIITDGFSCREQIDQSSQREALHLAQVIQLALKESGGKKR